MDAEGGAGPREGFTATPAPLSFGASRNQSDPGLPTESSLRQGPRFLACPPQLWASLGPQIVKNPPARQETWVRLLGRKIPWRRKLQPTAVFWPRKSSGQRILAGHRVPKSRTLSSVQFSLSVVADSLRPHESQHARPPCPSPSPGVHSDSRPSSP